MSQNTPHFDAVISVKTGKTGEDGRPQYRSTRLGVAFEDTRSSKRHITVYSDLFPHPIHLWERTRDGDDAGVGNTVEAGVETAPESDNSLDKPPF